MSIENEGWQKQRSIARNIHESGQQLVKEHAEAESAKAAKVMEVLHGAKPAENAKPAAEPSRAAKADQPIQQGRDVPPAPQKGHAETQQVAQQNSAAAERFREAARQQAKGLEQLARKAPAANASGQTATPQAVTQKGQTTMAQLARQPAPQANAGAKAAADQATRQTASKATSRAHQGKEVDGSGKQLPDGAPQVDSKQQAQGKESLLGTQQAASAAGAAQGAGEKSAKVDRSADDAGSEKKAERKGQESKRAGGAYAKPSNAGGELNALLHSGTGGGGFSNEGGQETAVAAVADAPRAAEELPEADPHTQVFGGEASHQVAVMQKARLYDRLVAKRLVEIAKLNEDFELGVVGVFQNVALSKRIVPGGGSAEDARMARELALAMIGQKGPYGDTRG